MLALKFDRKKYDRNLKEEGREDGIGIGENIGIDIGQVKTYICLVNDGEITIENAAKRLNITPEEFQNRLTIANEEGMETLEKLIRDERLRSDLQNIALNMMCWLTF